MNCHHCSTPLVTTAHFCHHCGTPVGAFVESGDAPDRQFDDQDVTAVGVDPSPTDGPADSDDTMRIAPAESDVWEGGFSPKAMFWTFAITAVVSAAALVGIVWLLVASHPIAALVIAVMLFVLWFVQVARIVKRSLGIRYRLTNRRMHFEVGLLSRRKHQLDLTRVEEVRVRQSGLQRLLDVGTIDLRYRDRRTPWIAIEGVSAPDGVSERIRAAVTTVAERREGAKQRPSAAALA